MTHRIRALGVVALCAAISVLACPAHGLEEEDVPDSFAVLHDEANVPEASPIVAGGWDTAVPHGGSDEHHEEDWEKNVEEEMIEGGYVSAQDIAKGEEQTTRRVHTHALVMAVAKGNVTFAKQVLSHGVDLDAVNERTVELTEEILQKKPELELPILPALHLAAGLGNEEMVRLLLMYGANPNLRRQGMDLNPNQKFTGALFYAVGMGQSSRIGVVATLLDYGAEYNEQDDDGFTPLIVAIRSRRRDLVYTLVMHGADVNAVTSEGIDALHYAAYDAHSFYSGHDEFLDEKHNILPLLLQNGAVPGKTVDLGGRTALHVAVKGDTLAALRGDTVSIKHMLPYTTDEVLHMRDKNGRTAHDIAVAHGFLEMMHVIESWDSHFKENPNEESFPDKLWNYFYGAGEVQIPKDLADSSDTPVDPKVLMRPRHRKNEVDAPREAEGKVDDVIYKGGWAQPSRNALKSTLEKAGAPLDLDRCDIDVVDGAKITNEEFIQNYFSIGKPVIIRNAIKHWLAFQKWTKKSLLEAYGSVKVPYAPVPYAYQFGDPATIKRGTVSEFVSQMPADTAESIRPDAPNNVIFDVDFMMREGAEEWPGDFEPPSTFGFCSSPGSEQFSIGPTFSGAPWHHHNHAYCAVVYGRKKWFILPPPYRWHDSVIHTKPVLKMLREDFTKDPHLMEAFECTQEAGDLLYIPAQWPHATLNLGETVGIAQEFCRMTTPIHPLMELLGDLGEDVLQAHGDYEAGEFDAMFGHDEVEL